MSAQQYRDPWAAARVEQARRDRRAKLCCTILFVVVLALLLWAI